MHIKRLVYNYFKSFQTFNNAKQKCRNSQGREQSELLKTYQILILKRNSGKGNFKIVFIDEKDTLRPPINNVRMFIIKFWRHFLRSFHVKGSGMRRNNDLC